MAERDDGLMRRAEVARIMSNSVRTLERWERAGYGPRPFRIGPRQIRYYRAEVMAWLAEQGRTPESAA